MKILLFVGALIIIGLIITGAITLQRSGDETITIQINKGRVKQDAAKALEKGREVILEAESAFRPSQPEPIKN
jgi:hypothetical protein